MSPRSDEYLILRSDPSTPASPSRYYSAFVIVYALALTYGSWLPFEFSPHTIRGAFARYREILARPVQWSTNADFSINALLWVPLAFAGMGAICAGKTSLWKALAVLPVLVGCGALSLLVEFGQAWIPLRNESQNDVAAQIIGAIAGCAAWIFIGDLCTRWAMDARPDSDGTARLRRLLQLYCLGFMLYAIMPLDLVSGGAEWVARFQDGTCNIAPLQGLEFKPSDLMLIVKKVAYWLPVGLLFGLSASTTESTSRLRIRAVVGGVFLLAAVEAAQSWVRSRGADINDVIFGSFGILVGVRFGLRLPFSQVIKFFAQEWSPILRATAALIALAYSIALLGLFWYPFNLVRDHREIAERGRTFFALPFVRLWAGSEFNALGQVVLKTGAFAILGVLLAIAVRSQLRERASHRRVLWTVLPSASLLAAIVEVGQIFVSQRFPDGFDVVIGGLGAALGVWLVEYLLEPLEPRTSPIRSSDKSRFPVLGR